jgi:two-component system sensor histidine kinase AtoS
MNESPGLLHTLLGLKQTPELIDVKCLLEMLPNAAMLVDSRSLYILSANSQLIKLTGYTHSELMGSQVANLFADWDEKAFYDLEPVTSMIGETISEAHFITRRLIQTNQETIDVDLACCVVHPRERYLLVLLEPRYATEYRIGQQPLHAQRNLFQQSSIQFWEALTGLFAAVLESELETALDLALHAASSLTGARLLAIYRVEDRTPRLQFKTGLGETHLFPTELSLQELLYLSKPGHWKTGNRPSCALHSAARAARLSYMTTAPVGPPNAMIGLVVMAGDQVVSPDYSLPASRITASVVASIFQQHAWKVNSQSEIQAQAAQLRVKATLEEQIHEGFVLLTPALKILKINLTAEMILGYASREVVDQAVEKLLIGPETLVPALTAAQNGIPTYNLGSVKLYRRNGDAFLALVRVLPVMNEERVEEIIVLFDDLSEQEEIRLHAEQLEQRALLGEVTAIFAHEVRNPINNISTGLQVMSMNLSPEDPRREEIARMLQDCDRLAELMKSVLSFARPTDYEMETLDMPLLLQRLLDRLRPRITKLNVQYDLKVETGCPPIQGNLRALEQVFSNLITNALQAMGKDGGSLVLKVQPARTIEGRSYLEVSVADTGPGIPKELQDRVFHPFFTTERNGTGLGLAIAKRVVTAHKGNIWLESFPVGTVFHVQFPAAGSTT